MNEEEFDWNKHMRVFTHEVAVQVRKNVTRQDVLLSLLKDDEIAFKLGDGSMGMFKVNEKFDRKELIKLLLTEPIMERAKQIKKEKLKPSQLTENIKEGRK